MSNQANKTSDNLATNKSVRKERLINIKRKRQWKSTILAAKKGKNQQFRVSETITITAYNGIREKDGPGT